MATIERDYSDAKKLRVVVVGAGIVGASIAYHLSRRKDVAVTVLERDEPCAGASGHSFAWLNSFGKDPVSYHHFNRRSMDIWDRFARRLGMDLDLHWGGELRWEREPERVEALCQRIKQLQAWGYPTRIISSDELCELEPGLSPGPVEIASFSEIDGRVDPLKVIEACLQRACEVGAVVHTHTPVVELCLDGRGKIEAVNTLSGEIGCDVVVLANGTAVTELAATAGVHIPQQHSPGVVVRTDSQPSILQNVSVLHLPPIDEDRFREARILDKSGHEIHLRQSADGTLAIGQGSQESVDQDDSQEHADDLLSRAVHYLPALAGARAIPTPVGYRPMPIDELPVIGFCAAAPNLYIALMHSGVTLAPLVGELATVEIVDGAHVEMLAPYRQERFISG